MIVNLVAYRHIRVLRDRIASIDDKLAQLKIIWFELSDEERLDPTNQKDMINTLTNARLMKYRASLAVTKLEKVLNDVT